MLKQGNKKDLLHHNLNNRINLQKHAGTTDQKLFSFPICLCFFDFFLLRCHMLFRLDHGTGTVLNRIVGSCAFSSCLPSMHYKNINQNGEC